MDLNDRIMPRTLPPEKFYHVSRSERIARLGSDDIMDYEYSAESRAMAYIARRVSEMKHGYTAGRITTKADNAAQCLPIGPDTNETPHLDAND